MSPAPNHPSEKEKVDRYSAAWAEIIRRVTEGHSWSGSERHNVYLNTGPGRFAGISFVSGLDHADDGRALGLVDWDQDGDLDLWFRNRTGPRLRFLANQTLRSPDHAFVALKLETRKGNRDAIGAVVEVIPARTKDSPDTARFVKSVRAGDLFLSQSSTWLHFGLGNHQSIDEVRVLWPGGEREGFTGIRPGERYLLREGAGKGILADGTGRRPLALRTIAGDSSAPAVPARSARIVLPARVPLFPSFSYRDAAGRHQSLGNTQQARLLVLWSESCAHCQSELQLLTESASALRAAELDVLALSVDALRSGETADDSVPTNTLMDRLGFPFPWGFVHEGTLERLQKLHDTLFDRKRSLSVPLTLLLDPAKNVLAIYRGAPAVASLLADAKTLIGATDETLHHSAPPMAGLWFTRPLDPAYVAENLARSFQKDFPEDSAAYLRLAATRAAGSRQEELRRELGLRYHVLARSYRDQERAEVAAFYFEEALRAASNSPVIHHDFGVFLASYGNLDEAETHLRRALELDPGSDSSRAALDMISKIRAGNER